MTLLPTEHQSIPQLIRNICRVWAKSFLSIFPIMILMCIAVAILGFLSAYPTLHLQSAFQPLTNISTIFIYIAISIIIFICYGAMYYRIYTIIYDKSATFWSALLIGIKKVIYVLLAIFITLIVLALIVLAICAPFFIALHVMTLQLPNFWPFQQILAGPRVEILTLITILIAYYFAAVLLLFYVALIIVDNLDPINAFSRSCYLVWGHWWHAASIVGILYFVFPPILFLLQWYIAYHLASPHLSPLNTWILATSLQNIVSIFYVPFYVSAVLVMLHDLKIRKHVAVP